VLEYGTDFQLGKEWTVIESEMQFMMGDETVDGKYDFSFVQPGSRHNLLGDFLGINATVKIGAGGKLTDGGFTAMEASATINSSIEQDVPLDPFSGFVGLGNNIVENFLKDQDGQSVAASHGFQFVDSSAFVEVEGGVVSKLNAFAQGSFAQGVSSTFRIPIPGTEETLMSLNVKVVNKNGQIQTQVTIGDIPVATNPDIRAQLTLEASISQSDAQDGQKRQAFSQSFLDQLNQITNQVGGGTWVPGAGGMWGTVLSQISDVVADQIFEADAIQQEVLTLDSIMQANPDLIHSLDPLFLDELFKANTDSLRIIVL